MTSADQSLPLPGQANGEPQPPLFPTLPVSLGDYELSHQLGSNALCDTYIARQGHVGRRVVLEVLRPVAEEEAEAVVAWFLALARARSGCTLPQVAPVLESATSPEGYSYICQALPEGSPLSAMAKEGKQLSPRQVCALISDTAKLYEGCAAAGLAAGDLRADMVFMDRAEGFHFLSPVQAASPAEAEACHADSAAQLRALAKAIRPVQPLNVPGQGRIATLLQWMQEGYEGEALDWPAIANTAELIAEQLKPESLLHVTPPQRYDRGREKRAGKRRRQQRRRGAMLIGAGVLVVLAMGVAGVFLAPDSVPPIPALRGGYVHARVGDKVVKVAPSPVSMAEYRRYLEAYPTLDAARRGSLTQNIPPTETDPTPTDWEAQLSAASPDAPVTNVSYWQALMYARCQRAALPGAALLAAAREQAGHPGIEEWTQDELPPAPPYTRARLVLPAQAGASPLPENNPAARHPQRGFRICR